MCWPCFTLGSLKPGPQYNADADVDTDAGIAMNPISASTSKDAAYVKALSLMLTLS